MPLPLIVVAFSAQIQARATLMLFSPITLIVKSLQSALKIPTELFPGAIVAFSRVSVLVMPSYFTIPLTPSITLRSLQLSFVTATPATLMA